MNQTVKRVLRVVFYPIVLIKRFIYIVYKSYLGKFYPIRLAQMNHKHYCGTYMDLENPKDINEKINWLKFYGDTSEWPRLSDKFAVREYVSSLGLEHMLVKLYGVWSDPRDINFDALPSRFVLKANNGSGTVMLVKNKEELNYRTVRRTLRRWLKLPFWIYAAEPHYLDIPPLIICEEYLEESQTQFSSSLIDYKFYCMNGSPKYVMVCYDRTIGSDSVYRIVYDLDFIPHHEFMKASRRDPEMRIIPKPKSYNEMLEAATILSKGFPQVRVDFYEVNGRPYFGEMTFTSDGGYEHFYTKDFLLRLGEFVKL